MSDIDTRISELKQIITYYLTYRQIILRQVISSRYNHAITYVRGTLLHPKIDITVAAVISDAIEDYLRTLSEEELTIIDYRLSQRKTYEATSGLVSMSRTACFAYVQHIIDNALFYVLITPSDARDVLLNQTIDDYTIHYDERV